MAKYIDWLNWCIVGNLGVNGQCKFAVVSILNVVINLHRRAIYNSRLPSVEKQHLDTLTKKRATNGKRLVLIETLTSDFNLGRTVGIMGRSDGSKHLITGTEPMRVPPVEVPTDKIPVTLRAFYIDRFFEQRYHTV